MGDNQMSWEKLFCKDRLGSRESKTEQGRSAFHSDHDKVIFSGAFRRLAKKTQVHPLATNDHIHNRLTHSLEVACVGRSLGIRVGQKLKDLKKLPENISEFDVGDIVQTACLAHDIGNPPFGHTGEEAIKHWFRNEGRHFTESLSHEEKQDLENFEGNAQGLRVLTTSEYHPYEEGMRLTYASLASFIKYPWTSIRPETDRPKKGKFGIYQSERRYFNEIANKTGLIQKGPDWYCRHPLVHLMEAADDFCYGLLDLEDGLEMGILTWDNIFDTLKPVLDPIQVSSLEEELKRHADGRKPPLLRGKIISTYVEAAANAFISNERDLLNGSVVELIPLCPKEIKESVENSKKLARDKIFNHPRKIELEIGCYSIMGTLLSVLCSAAKDHITNPEHKTFRSKRALSLIGEDTFPQRSSQDGSDMYLAMMRVMDFVGGMTDNYATFLAKQFNGMGEVR